MRSVEKITPADPANLESHESIVQQAGQVWYVNTEVMMEVTYKITTINHVHFVFLC